MHAVHRALGAARPEVLTRDGCGGPHQPHRGPRDERKQLRVAHRVGGLRLGALRERADEAQQQHPGDVHRDPLDAGGQAEAEQRPDDGPVGPPVHVAVPLNRQPPGEQQIHGEAAQGEARDGTPDRCARRAQARQRSDARDERHVADHVQGGEEHAQAQRRTRVPRRPEGATHHEEQQHADTAHEHDTEEGQGLSADRGGGVHDVQQRRREHPAEGCEHHAPQRQRGKERLVHGAVDLVGVVRPREAGHEDAHPGEHRHDERDDDDEDLDGDADRCVPGVPHVVAYERVIHDALKPADEVLHGRRPGEQPDGAGDRTLDDGPIEDRVGGAATCHAWRRGSTDPRPRPTRTAR